MKRRNFIKAPAAGSAFMATNNPFMFRNIDETDIMSNNSIDPVIPLRIFQYYKEEILS